MSELHEIRKIRYNGIELSVSTITVQDDGHNYSGVIRGFVDYEKAELSPLDVLDAFGVKYGDFCCMDNQGRCFRPNMGDDQVMSKGVTLEIRTATSFWWIEWRVLLDRALCLVPCEQPEESDAGKSG